MEKSIQANIAYANTKSHKHAAAVIIKSVLSARHKVLVAAARGIRRDKHEYEKQIAEQAADAAISIINDITGNPIPVPKVNMDLRRRKARKCRGYFLPYIPDSVYITKNQFDVSDLVFTAIHEAVHYARKDILNYRSNFDQVSAPQSSAAAVEEGISNFVANYVILGDYSAICGKILLSDHYDHNSLENAILLYDAIKADNNKKPKHVFSGKTFKFLTRHNYYDSGSAMTTLLLVSNNFDIDAMVKYFLTTSNLSISAHLSETVLHDSKNEIRSKLENIRLLKNICDAEADSRFERNAIHADRIRSLNVLYRKT